MSAHKPVDYESLLRKYIAFVDDCEGSNYLDSVGFHPRSDVEFTDSEAAELERLSREADLVPRLQKPG